jgi:hypothetical protein
MVMFGFLDKNEKTTKNERPGMVAHTCILTLGRLSQGRSRV